VSCFYEPRVKGSKIVSFYYFDNNNTQSPSQATRPIERRWSPFPQPSARHQFTLPDHGYAASTSRGVPVYVPAFTGTHCAYPRRDGQAELTWVAGYVPRRFTRLQTVTHPSTNRARRWLTSLMRPTTEPLTVVHSAKYTTDCDLTPFNFTNIIIGFTTCFINHANTVHCSIWTQHSLGIPVYSDHAIAAYFLYFAKMRISHIFLHIMAFSKFRIFIYAFRISIYAHMTFAKIRI